MASGHLIARFPIMPLRVGNRTIAIVEAADTPALRAAADTELPRAISPRVELLGDQALPRELRSVHGEQS
jgi:hypothetical protein